MVALLLKALPSYSSLAWVRIESLSDSDKLSLQHSRYSAANSFCSHLPSMPLLSFWPPLDQRASPQLTLGAFKYLSSKG